MHKKPQLNAVERAIAGISPKWGFDRLKNKTALALAEGYHGASNSRAAMRDWRTTASDANAEVVHDLPTLRARARDLVRNAPLAAGAINTMVTNVVGTGLSLQSRIDPEALGMTDAAADAWQRTTEREFRLWCESPDADATRVQNFYGLQSLAFRSALESGDVVSVLPSIVRRNSPYTLAVQLIEADRICNPRFTVDTDRLTAGIEIDSYGAPVACHICDIHPGNMRSAQAATWQRVGFFGAQTGRRNIIHLFDRRRPGQLRGIPVLAPVIEPLKQLGRYTEAELQSAVISGAFSVFVKMDAESFNDLFDGDSGKKYIESAAKWDGGMNRNSLDGPGKAVNLLPGESIETANPGRPNSEFDPFVQAIVRQIGVALELPFEVLIKHFTASYSAARAALLDAWRFFRGRRDWLAGNFCQPIYELWLEEAVAIGRIDAPGFFADPVIRKAYSGAIWVGDGPGSIDPAKEVKAAENRIKLGISTVSAESILHDGVDWEGKHRQRSKEHAMRKAAGLEFDPTAQGAEDAESQQPEDTDAA
jgi:lambda family phage portal protein